MNRIIKITIVLLIVFTIFGCFYIVNAAPTEGTDATGGNGGNGTIDIKTKDTRDGTEQKKSNWTDIFSLGDKFIREGKANPSFTGKDNLSEEDIQKESSNIFNMIVAIGTVLTVIVGGILGIKFMFSSIEEKAKIKEALIPYILGCVVIYGAYGIWFLVVSLLNKT